MTTTTTLGDVAGISFSAVRILENHGLDYCCGGKRPFEQACAAKHLDPQAILLEIEQAEPTDIRERDWQIEPLDELVKHIVETHHRYLMLELPAIDKRLAKILEVHGARDPERLSRMAAVFGSLRDELELHMRKEESILFPFIERYAKAAAQGSRMPPVPFGSIANPIAMMEREHGDAGDALGELRAMTGDYQLPSYACSTVRALYEGLQRLEADLHVHIHLENNILFPRAIALEQR